MEILLIKFLLLAISIFIVGKATKLFQVDDFFTAFLAAVLLALVNAVIRPILILLTFPLTLITLGLFLLFINGFCLILVSKLIPKFQIKGCLTSAVAAILISLLNVILEALVVI